MGDYSKIMIMTWQCLIDDYSWNLILLRFYTEMKTRTDLWPMILISQAVYLFLTACSNDNCIYFYLYQLFASFFIHVHRTISQQTVFTFTISLYMYHCTFDIQVTSHDFTCGMFYTQPAIDKIYLSYFSCKLLYFFRFNLRMFLI